MNKKSLAIIAIAVILVGAGWSVHVLSSKSPETSETNAEKTQVQVIDVDAVVNSPEKFAGVIGVEGTVTTIDEPNNMLTLGCEDACVLMPVKYAGLLPKEGTNIIAYGEVTMTEHDKYIFIAQEIEAK